MLIAGLLACQSPTGLHGNTGNLKEMRRGRYGQPNFTFNILRRICQRETSMTASDGGSGSGDGHRERWLCSSEEKQLVEVASKGLGAGR